MPLRFLRHLSFIILGYVLAGAAAGLVVAGLGALFALAVPGGSYDDFFPGFLFVALIFLAVSFIPFGLLIIATEAFRLRSVFIYALFAATVFLIWNFSFELPSSPLKILRRFWPRFSGASCLGSSIGGSPAAMPDNGARLSYNNACASPARS